MKFKQRAGEKTLDILVQDVDVRFAPNGYRLMDLYVIGFDTIHFEMWDEHLFCDDQPCRLSDLLELICPHGRRGEPQLITVTGQSREREFNNREGEKVTLRYFTVKTWTSHAADTPLPDNITEVPY